MEKETDIFPGGNCITLTEAHCAVMTAQANHAGETESEVGKHWEKYDGMEPQGADAPEDTWECYGIIYNERLRSLAEFLRARKGADVTIRINSPGGDYTAGIAMANRLHGYKGKVTTIIDGMAASAAGLLFVAGAERKMEDGSLLMLHPVWMFAAVNQYEAEKICETLKEIDSAMVDFLSKRLSLPKDKIPAFLKEEKFMSRESAEKIGALSAADDNDEKKKAQAEAQSKAWEAKANATIRRRLGIRGSQENA